MEATKILNGQVYNILSILLFHSYQEIVNINLLWFKQHLYIDGGTMQMKLKDLNLKN